MTTPRGLSCLRLRADSPMFYRWRLPPLFCVICLWLMPWAPAAAEVIFAVKGVNDTLRTQITRYVGKPAGDTPTDVRIFISDLPTEIEKALQAVGYYNSRVQVSQQRQVRDDEDVRHSVTADVEAGPPTRIETLRIRVFDDGGDITTGPFKDFAQSLTLRRGDVFNHGQYQTAKDAFFAHAQDQGYFDAAFTQSRVTVNRQQNTASVDIAFHTGPRYRLGEVRFSDTLLSDTFLQRWVPFSSGTPYRAALIADLTRQLQSSGYFSRVRVESLRDEAVDLRVPLQVTLAPEASNNVGFGIGFATDTGPRARMTWRRPHHNRHGHSLDLSTGISEVRQVLAAQYKIPRKQRPQTDYFGIDVGAQNEDTEDTLSQLRTLSVKRVRETSARWQESVFVRWEHEKFEAAGEDSDTIDLLLPGVSWSRTRVRGGTSPYWGQQLSVQFMGGHSDLFSDIDLFKSVLGMKWLRTFGDKHKLILGLDYGAISSEDFDRVPASHRFYIGGDRSVRGFKYRSISPEDSDGELTGGRFMEVGSIEYDYNLYQKWSVATFIDAGRAFDHFDERYRVGTGVGVRWQSPVGPLRLDLAVGVSEDDRPIRFHLSLGPDL